MKAWKAFIGFWNSATALGGGDVESLFSFVCTFRIIKQVLETSGLAEVEVRRNDDVYGRLGHIWTHSLSYYNCDWLCIYTVP
jgi:hypothetical protein